MQTLHLVLKGHWYDKIASGEKTSEYRECKPYWNHRFAHCESMKYIEDSTCLVYDTVVFHRGYTSQTMAFKITTIQLLRNRPNDLGLAECWEIKLGDRIK